MVGKFFPFFKKVQNEKRILFFSIENNDCLTSSVEYTLVCSPFISHPSIIS